MYHRFAYCLYYSVISVDIMAGDKKNNLFSNRKTYQPTGVTRAKEWEYRNKDSFHGIASRNAEYDDKFQKPDKYTMYNTKIVPTSHFVQKNYVSNAQPIYTDENNEFTGRGTSDRSKTSYENEGPTKPTKYDTFITSSLDHYARRSERGNKEFN